MNEEVSEAVVTLRDYCQSQDDSCAHCDMFENCHARRRIDKWMPDDVPYGAEEDE